MKITTLVAALGILAFAGNARAQIRAAAEQPGADCGG
jgi:hypothetical protein